ncbi:rhomboid family intramembrane serine protease [candidate division KSB1 bacterium]|nr:rhomboid family intramembrane serine protease [candidate division KSB1 bacterium]
MQYFEKTHQPVFYRKITPSIKWLLIINAGITLISLSSFFQDLLTEWFALSTFAVIHQFQLWKLLSYLFLHFELLHLFFNMFMLWMFGTEVEAALKPEKFLKLYIFSGVGAGLFQMFFNSSVHDIVIGASGAVYGVMMAFAVLFKDHIITLLLFFIFPVRMKAKVLIPLLIGSSIVLFMFWGENSRVAHMAHLGGAICGLLFIFFGDFMEQSKFYIQKHKEKQEENSRRQYEQKKQNFRQEIDLILDKINEIGYQNLTKEEKHLLTEYSKLLLDEEKR